MLPVDLSDFYYPTFDYTYYVFLAYGASGFLLGGLCFFILKRYKKAKKTLDFFRENLKL